MSSLQAMEWLIQHQGDPDIDEQIPPTPTNSTQNISLSQVDTTLSLSISKGTTEESPNTNNDELSTKLNKTKKYSRRRKWEFVPDQVVSAQCIVLPYTVD